MSRPIMMFGREVKLKKLTKAQRGATYAQAVRAEEGRR